MGSADGEVLYRELVCGCAVVMSLRRLESWRPRITHPAQDIRQAEVDILRLLFEGEIHWWDRMRDFYR